MKKKMRGKSFFVLLFLGAHCWLFSFFCQWKYLYFRNFVDSSQWKYLYFSIFVDWGLNVGNRDFSPRVFVTGLRTNNRGGVKTRFPTLSPQPPPKIGLPVIEVSEFPALKRLFNGHTLGSVLWNGTEWWNAYASCLGIRPVYRNNLGSKSEQSEQNNRNNGQNNGYTYSHLLLFFYVTDSSLHLHLLVETTMLCSKDFPSH